MADFVCYIDMVTFTTLAATKWYNVTQRHFSLFLFSYTLFNVITHIFFILGLFASVKLFFHFLSLQLTISVFLLASSYLILVSHLSGYFFLLSVQRLEPMIGVRILNLTASASFTELPRKVFDYLHAVMLDKEECI